MHAVQYFVRSIALSSFSEERDRNHSVMGIGGRGDTSELFLFDRFASSSESTPA